MTEALDTEFIEVGVEFSQTLASAPIEPGFKTLNETEAVLVHASGFASVPVTEIVVFDANEIVYVALLVPETTPPAGAHE